MPRRAPKTLSERFNLDEIIVGLASDLRELRAGKIPLANARLRAELAREILRGVKLTIEAQKFMEARALPAPVRD